MLKPEAGQSSERRFPRGFNAGSCILKPSVVILLLIGACPARSASSADADSQEFQARALLLIKQTAIDLCTTVPIEGSSRDVLLSERAKLTVSGLLKKVADLGGEEAARFQSDQFKNVLQKDLASTIKAGNDCKLDVLHFLGERLLPRKPSPQGPSPDRTKLGQLKAEIRSARIADPALAEQIKALDVTSRNELILFSARLLNTEYHEAIRPFLERPEIVAGSPCSDKHFPEEAFRRTRQIISLLLHVDRNNGHAIYFSSEVNRLVGLDGPRLDDLKLYLDHEGSLPESERSGSQQIQVCAERPHGYCPQRTGWIAHHLANYFLERADSEAAEDSRGKDLSTSLQYALLAQRTSPPNGFTDCVATDVVIRRTSSALK